MRDELNLQEATDVHVGPECSPCGSDVRNERLQVGLDGGPATLTEIVRSDGSEEWYLVVQSYCGTFVMGIVVSPGHVGDFHDAVDHVLASLRLKPDPWPLPVC